MITSRTSGDPGVRLALCGICYGATCAALIRLVAAPNVLNDHLTAPALAHGYLAATFVTMTPVRPIEIAAALDAHVLRELNGPVDGGRCGANARHTR